MIQVDCNKVVISRKTVKSSKNKIGDTNAPNLRRHGFSVILAHTVELAEKWSNQLTTQFLVLVY